MGAVPGVQTQREMSQQLLECSRSLRKSTACLMHPPLLELTPKHTLTHGAWFLLVVPFNEEEGFKGLGGVLCGFFRISGVVPLQICQKLKTVTVTAPIPVFNK